MENHNTMKKGISHILLIPISSYLEYEGLLMTNEIFGHKMHSFSWYK